jgi:hypothetical protein
MHLCLWWSPPPIHLVLQIVNKLSLSFHYLLICKIYMIYFVFYKFSWNKLSIVISSYMIYVTYNVQHKIVVKDMRVNYLLSWRYEYPLFFLGPYILLSMSWNLSYESQKNHDRQCELCRVQGFWRMGFVQILRKSSLSKRGYF